MKTGHLLANIGADADAAENGPDVIEFLANVALAAGLASALRNLHLQDLERLVAGVEDRDVPTRALAAEPAKRFLKLRVQRQSAAQRCAGPLDLEKNIKRSRLARTEKDPYVKFGRSPRSSTSYNVL